MLGGWPSAGTVQPTTVVCLLCSLGGFPPKKANKQKKKQLLVLFLWCMVLYHASILDASMGYPAKTALLRLCSQPEMCVKRQQLLSSSLPSLLVCLSWCSSAASVQNPSWMPMASSIWDLKELQILQPDVNNELLNFRNKRNREIKVKRGSPFS